MNYPPQYRQPQQNIRSALINQSQKRYAFYADALMKLKAGFGQLQAEAQNAAMALSQRDPTGHQQFQMSLGAVMRAAEESKRELERQMQAELRLQNELERWLAGQPPSDFNGQQRGPLEPMQAQGWTQQSQGPQQGWPQQQPQYPQGQQAPLAPEGPPDLRDPRQAAAALLRAEPMPLGPVGAGGPQQQQPMPGYYPQQGPAYVPPGSYASPPAGTYGAPPQQFPVPTVAPVAMQYADPAAPNMPAVPPVVQYQTPTGAPVVAGPLAQAAETVSAAALNANGAGKPATP